MTTTTPRRIILDVDTGTDDAIALGLAARSPGVELVAVTTVAGNVILPYTTDNTLRVLHHLGATDTAIHAGFSRPLARPLHDASEVHGNSGLGSLVLPESPAEARYPSAPQLIVDRLTAEPGAITLVFVGPLTNLAAAIALEPSLPELMAGLVVMGGALGPGNVTHYAEFNIYCDPEAAAQVFAACPLTMVGLDVSHQTILGRAAWERLAAIDTPEATLVRGAAADHFERRGKEGMYLHDPLALMVAIDPTLCEMKRGRVKVETATAWCAGQTTLTESEDGPHQVCVGVDAPRALRVMSEVLSLPLTSEG
jgi:inosine-uridine nucleoside N-ribohydrolase